MEFWKLYDDGRMSIPDEIRPPEILWEATNEAMCGWSEADKEGTADMMPMLFTPLQTTLMGVDMHSLDKVDTEDTLTRYYQTRHTVETLASRLEDHFFNDPSCVQHRLSYAPVRMLGWWNRCLSDEIDWLLDSGCSLKDPYDVRRPWKQPVQAPPRFWRWELRDDTSLRSVCSQIAVMQGLKDEAADVMLDVLHSIADDDDDNSVMDGLVEMMKARKPVGVVVGIDVETTGLKAMRDWLINAGWLLTDLNDPDEKLWGQASRSYGVPRVREVLGNPTEYISGISTIDIAGLKPINDDVTAQKEILDVVTSHPYVAHSSNAEDSFFKQNVAGYAEAKRDGMVRIIDSRSVSQRLDDYPGKISNRLEDYAKHWGVLPENGRERHLGLDDSTIMLKAMGRNLRSLHGGPDSSHYRNEMAGRMQRMEDPSC